MFERLIRYDRILVTGPQRSGTRIAAKMIAQDTGHAFVDEHEFGVHSRQRFAALLAGRNQIAVQCPTMCWCIHEHAGDGTLVVLMVRNLDDIVASEQRISWTGGPYIELKHYGMERENVRKFRRGGGRVADVKYAVWLAQQRAQIPHYLELEYKLLARHPLWIPKSQRGDFGAEQTER